MRALPCLLASLLLSTFGAGQTGSLAELQQKADLAKGGDCTHLSMQAARQTLEESNRLFGAGDGKAAHSDVDLAVHFVQHSVDCSVQTRKGEKSAEIDLRKLIRRMKDILQTLDSEDRPHLKQSMVELESQRDRLLQSMFGTSAHHAGDKTP
jgi:hypothetical protein